jgi:hypothetical protein
MIPALTLMIGVYKARAYAVRARTALAAAQEAAMAARQHLERTQAYCGTIAAELDRVRARPGARERGRD